jgi:NAD(P)-dependent dehydrogenase (short-subunit alcohol dehydrogenase family)
MDMVDVFGATSTTDEVLSEINLEGKRILVTGVSAGLGIETARSLAAHGADVVGAARDLKKAEDATAQVPCQIKERTGNEQFHPSRGWPGPFEKETAHERRPPKLSVL